MKPLITVSHRGEVQIDPPQFFFSRSQSKVLCAEQSKHRPNNYRRDGDPVEP